jgi:hypothetical protein
MVRAFGCSILVAIALTVVLFPWLQAGHASPVIFLVPGLFIAYLLCGPRLLERGHDRRARLWAAVVSGLVFFLALGLSFVLAMAVGGALLGLALPLVHLLTSSLLFEAVYRLRGEFSPAALGDPAAP